MRVAMVSEHANPMAAQGSAEVGGQHVHVAGLARALAERGHEVVVHTRRDDPDPPELVTMAPGVQVHHVAAGPARHVAKEQLLPYLPDFARALEQQWTHTRPDVVHAHFWMSGIVAVQAAAPLGVPVAETFHALGAAGRRLGEIDPSPPGRLDAERSLARHVGSVLVTAAHEVAELVAMGADESRIQVIPCGVDVRLMHPPASGPPARPRRRLLSLGQLVPSKGVDDAIRMLQWLPDVQLLVAGGPPLARIAEDPEVARLREVAGQAGVGERVSFLGSVGRADVPALLHSVDLAICLPRHEPFGLVPLEAMACGVPVIGSRVGGLVDTIEDGRTGLLVPPNRPDLAARAVRSLLDAPGRLQAMAQRGPHRVAQQYSWQHVARLTEAAYLRLIRSQASPGLSRVGALPVPESVGP